jgi:hypothetical protein
VPTDQEATPDEVTPSIDSTVPEGTESMVAEVVAPESVAPESLNPEPQVNFISPPLRGSIHGPLRRGANACYFTDDTGQAIYLAGAETGFGLQDNMWGVASSDDLVAQLDALASRGLNFLRLWNVESTTNTARSSFSSYPEGVLASPMPFARGGDELANDGLPRFDLTQFDESYFDRLRSVISAAADRGIYVAVKLFEGWSTSSAQYGGASDPWPFHPFNAANNVNGIDGDANGDGDGADVHSLANPDVVALQKAYVQKVIETVNDLDNVLYEISNEDASDSVDWQYAMIRFIHDEEAGLPYQHPVGMTSLFAPDNDALVNSPADYISPGGSFPDSVSALAGAHQVIIADTDHLRPVPDASFPLENFRLGFNANVMVWEDARVPVSLDDPAWADRLDALGQTRLLPTSCPR